MGVKSAFPLAMRRREVLFVSSFRFRRSLDLTETPDTIWIGFLSESAAPSSSLAQDTGFSVQEQGFKSPWGHSLKSELPRLAARTFFILAGGKTTPVREVRHGIWRLLAIAV